MTPDDIEDAACWTGDNGVLYGVLNGSFIDLLNGEHYLHDWERHQGYIFYAEERSDNARKAGLASGESRKKGIKTDNRTGSSTGCSTGSPTPSPSPLPSPTPLPTPKSSDKSKLEPYIAFAKELFPDSKGRQLDKQGEVLEMIVRIDKCSFDWLQRVLLWATTDDFWGGTPFQSCSQLRKRKELGSPMKWEVISTAYKKAKGIKAPVKNLGWKCDACGLMGEGSPSGECPNCGDYCYSKGTLKPGWQERNKRIKKPEATNNKVDKAVKSLSGKLNMNKRKEM